MKRQKILLSLVCFIMLTFSCKKDSTNSQPKVVTPTVLTGTWELRQDSFPQIRGVPRDYASGNGNKVIFYDTTYKSYYVGYGSMSGTNYTDSGNYYIKDLPQSIPQLVFNGDSLPPRDLFLINKDTLTLYAGIVAADGDVLVYVKIN
ncbi:MAG TPA: hypothetical protein VHT72_05930 [Puia sp.]|jgi:hypothetical protein|nr:hypothetical protein [Puia sp.]